MPFLSESYSSCVRYIFSNADFSSAGRRYQNPLENWKRFEALLEKIGSPMGRLKVVHIAGTNGKGTTSALCDAMLRASGKRVGLFTSPHLHSFRERIRLDGKLVSKEAIVEAMDVVRPAVEAIGYASPFEKLSALALVCFARAEVEWAVLETGLGGRWDCTNHCEPQVCGITRIGMDHMNVLGNTVAEIASEKAGIIKRGVPAFCVPQDPTALPVLQAAAEQVGSTLQVVSETDRNDSIPPWLAPAHQQLNAALASAMLHSLAARGLLSSQPELWRRARDTCHWPARFELFEPQCLRSAASSSPPPVLLLDVAHNEPAVEALLRSVDHTFPNAPLALIFGVNRDKDLGAIAKLFTSARRLRAGIAVLSSHPKATPTDEIIAACNAAAASLGADEASDVRWRQSAGMLEALQMAKEALAEGGVVLCCGSVFVAADMRAALAQSEPQLFDPLDPAFEQQGEPHLLM